MVDTKSKKDWRLMEFQMQIKESHTTEKDFVIRGVAIK